MKLTVKQLRQLVKEEVGKNVEEELENQILTAKEARKEAFNTFKSVNPDAFDKMYRKRLSDYYKLAKDLGVTSLYNKWLEAINELERIEKKLRDFRIDSNYEKNKEYEQVKYQDNSWAGRFENK